VQYDSTSRPVWSHSDGLFPDVPVIKVGKNQLDNEEVLSSNEAFFCNNGNYFLYMQTDGNVCLYRASTAHKIENADCEWATNTGGMKFPVPYKFKCQGDGNVVLYDG